MWATATGLTVKSEGLGSCTTPCLHPYQWPSVHSACVCWVVLLFWPVSSYDQWCHSLSSWHVVCVIKGVESTGCINIVLKGFTGPSSRRQWEPFLKRAVIPALSLLSLFPTDMVVWWHVPTCLLTDRPLRPWRGACVRVMTLGFFSPDWLTHWVILEGLLF